MKKPAIKKIFKIPGFIKKHKVITIVAVIALIVSAGAYFLRGTKTAAVKTQNIEVTAQKGSVKVEITGSGTIEANEQYEITALVKGDVVADYFEEGDILEEGAVMYSIDPASVNKSIDRQKNSLSKTETSYQNAVEDMNNLSVKASVGGTLTALNVKKGDTVNSGMVVATIVDSSKLKLKINFNTVDAQMLYVGAPADVTLSSSSYVLQGVVTSVATGSIVHKGVSATPVEIVIDNPGTVVEGDKATAVSCSVACLDEGTFEVNAYENVKTKVSGEIAVINYNVGDVVTEGSTIFKMTSKSITQNLENAKLSKEDAYIGLEDLYDNLDDYTITAPIKGTVIDKTIKKGDKLDNISSSTVMAVIADMSRMLFTIYVDELDFPKIKEGQNVTVTCDALDGKVFTGYVDKVSLNGTTSNSVTTYPVTIVVNNPEGLMPGFNVDASIAVEEKTDVLTIPINAIQRGGIVYVKDEDIKPEQKKVEPKNKNNSMKGAKDNKSEGDSGKQKETNPYEGYTPVRVEVGLSNNDVSEIVSGLYEGQRILVVIPVASGSGTQLGNRGGMPGGMGGGMPGGMGGGMPGASSYGNRNGMSGGFSSGNRNGMSGGFSSGNRGGTSFGGAR